MRNPGNTGKFTRKILFPGPRIAVRGDTLSHTAPRRGIQKYLGERVPVVIPLMP